jgi:signal transduction histidine kinase
MTPTRSPVYFLAVDDVEENLIALDALLKREGLVVLRARSGRDALEQLLKHDVALALIDVHMPEMDGFELAELMRGTGRTQRVPIIFLTAGTTDSQRRFRGYEAGAVDFLYKPIEPHILRSKSNVFFDLYRQRQEVAAQRDELKTATEENARLLEESRRYAAALQKADQRKDEFLAMLAHELRNPLAPIRSAVELLRLSTGAEGAETDVTDIIARQVGHMSRLIDGLLDVARIARGRIELVKSQCDLNRIARQTADDYSPTFASAGVKLDVNLTEEPLPVFGDQTRLTQVIGNLLHNAGKFTGAGGRVTVATSLNETKHSAVISVTDTGAGLEADSLSRIFEPFEQVGKSFESTQGGLGLGLAVAKGLVELHAGSIAVESEGIGKGARFTATIPVTVVQCESGATSDGPIERHRQLPLKILLIEDNQDAASLLRRLLIDFGHSVQIAFDGRWGLNFARDFRPDVVVSDLRLPGDLSGYDVARLIRSDSQMSNIRLIALSGYGDEQSRKLAHQAGFGQYLVKPVEVAALATALAQASQADDS